MTDAERDRTLVVMVAFDEASDQGRQGIRAQLWSVFNRHAAGKWYSGKTLGATVMMAWQYSAMNTSDPNRIRGAVVPTIDSAWIVCEQEYDAVVAGTSIDPTNGATHYYRQGTQQPHWVMGLDPKTGKQVAPPAVFCTQVGDHLFYRGVK